MTVCKFWMQGNCRYGNSCKFEHPIANQNRFGAFGGPSVNTSASTAAQKEPENPYNVTAAGIVKDLTEELPTWVFSAYGPGRNAPGQLFGGSQTEQSFEELRLHHWKSLAAGNPQVAITDLDTLYRQIQLQMENAKNNPTEAMRFVLQSENQHPNRQDICKSNSLPNTTGEFAVGRHQPQQTGAFGSAGQSTMNPFGQPSAAAPSAFSQAAGSAFGRPSQLGQGAFGQPSQLGSGSAFGKPSQLGATSAFGQPSQPGATSAFGQPSQPGATSAFGQPSQLGATSAFGQPSQPGTTSAFGQPSQPGATSAFGQPSQLGGNSAFGKPSQLGGASAFGQPSALGQKPAFGAPAFGQPSASGPSGFSKFAQATPTIGNAFGQPSQPGQNAGGASAFGQPSKLGGGPAFGQPSGFAAAAATQSPFAAAAANTASPFAAQSAAAAPAAAANPFSQAAQQNAAPSPFGQMKATADPFRSMQNNQAATAPAASGTPSPFGQPSSGAAPALNPFQQAVQNQAQTQNQTQNQGQNPFGKPSGTGAFGNAALGAGAAPATAVAATANGGPAGPSAGQQHPAVESYASYDQAGNLVQFKGQAVSYQTKDGVTTPTITNASGKPVKIWFPKGPPAFNKDTELGIEAYNNDVKVQYEGFMKSGKFESGFMPELPPRREWCLWDF